MHSFAVFVDEEASVGSVSVTPAASDLNVELIEQGTANTFAFSFRFLCLALHSLDLKVVLFFHFHHVLLEFEIRSFEGVV